MLDKDATPQKGRFKPSFLAEMSKRTLCESIFHVFQSELRKQDLQFQHTLTKSSHQQFYEGILCTSKMK